MSVIMAPELHNPTAPSNSSVQHEQVNFPKMPISVCHSYSPKLSWLSMGKKKEQNPYLTRGNQPTISTKPAHRSMQTYYEFF